MVYNNITKKMMTLILAVVLFVTSVFQMTVVTKATENINERKATYTSDKYNC